MGLRPVKRFRDRLMNNLFIALSAGSASAMLLVCFICYRLNAASEN